MTARSTVALAGLALLLAAGCAHYPVNQPLARLDPSAGYRFQNLAHDTNSDSLLIILAFSGGGKRAAALSYGVLEELARTRIAWGGDRRRLLDEVDVISSVSGGSFTAAYYALHGDGIFQDFEPRFLKKNMGGRLWGQYCLPVNWFRLASPHYDRIDMVADYLDRRLFDRQTFGDLLQRGQRPYVMINATDMALGSRFEFTQEQFDLIYSDLSSFPIARAVAASSAFPVILSPATLRNYSSARTEAEPEWIRNALHNGTVSSRRRNRAMEARSYLDVSRRPYLHFLDGGLADNLGLRGPLDMLLEQETPWQAMRAFQLQSLRKVVLIVVNASVPMDNGSERTENAPGLFSVLRAAQHVPINRYSFETVELFNEYFERWAQEIRVRREKIAALQRSQEGFDPRRLPPSELTYYSIELSFDAVPDEKERAFFKSLPTSLTLPPETVDRLRAVAAQLLRQSGQYQRLLKDLGAETGKAGK
ncbi:MAG: patatin-like phospholipase family protein [Verrucomicrobiota bacterium]